MRLIRTYLIAVISLIILNGCSDDDKNVGIGESINDFKLVSPVNFTQWQLNPGTPNKTVTLSWEAVKTGKGSSPSYTFMLDEVGGDFSTPIFESPADNGGLSNNITFTVSELIEAVEGSATSDFQWKVVARTEDDLGDNEKEAINSFSIKIMIAATGISDFGYLSPDVNEMISVSRLLSPNDEVDFAWEEATSSEEITYVWQASFTPDGFDEPAIEMSSNNGGLDAVASVTHATIVNALEDADYPDGFYWRVVASNTTLSYTPEVRFVWFDVVGAPPHMYLVGGSTSAGWNPPGSIEFIEFNEGRFELYTYLTVAGDGFKFLQIQDWPGDWGPSSRTVDGNGVISGSIVQEGESNATVNVDGFYRVTLDFSTLSYKVEPMTWAIIGSARTGSDETGWSDPDSDMSFAGGYTWEIDIHLLPGQFKFRANNTWDVNFGDDGLDGSLEYGAGTNIPIAAEGDYHIELILAPTGYTYTIELQ